MGVGGIEILFIYLRKETMIFKKESIDPQTLNIVGIP
jgi:hypothetical protein